MSYSQRVIFNGLSKVVAKRTFSTYKQSTGLVGLRIDPNGRENLHRASMEILESVKRIPEDAGYRIAVEKWYKFISKTCADMEDIKAIEDEIGLGQIEEVIDMAKGELTLVDFYIAEDGYERMKKAHADADYTEEGMKDYLFFAKQRAEGDPKVEAPPEVKK